MPDVTWSALLIVVVLMAGYAQYWIVRRAVAAGIRDARHAESSDERLR